MCQEYTVFTIPPSMQWAEHIPPKKTWSYIQYVQPWTFFYSDLCNKNNNL